MIQKLTIAICLTCLFSCGQQNVDTKSEGEQLMQLSRDWSTAASKGNIDTTLAYWADDATVMSPGQPPLKGKKAIREMLEETSKIPGFKISWEPKTVTVSKSGDMAYMTEENQVTMNDSLGKPFTENNKAVTVWRKEADGKWKNVVDMWNANPR
jgi:uncharacterized protein (TIGR02246 family)